MPSDEGQAWKGAAMNILILGGGGREHALAWAAMKTQNATS